MRAVGKVQAHLGSWSFKRTDTQGNLYANTRRQDEPEDPFVDNWQDLFWEHGPDDPLFDGYPLVAEQEKLPADLIPFIKVTPKKLGAGTFGVVYKCTIRLPHRQFATPCVVKISKDMIDSYVYVIQPNGLILKTRNTCRNYEDCKDGLIEEMEWFEKIWEPEEYVQRFGTGGRGYGITLEDLKRYQAQDSKLTSDFAGRGNIHRYFHLDQKIPAIISEACDGDLVSLRREHENAFMAPAPNQLSPLWCQCAMEIAGALTYMRHQGVAHCDVKPDNILYQKRLPHYEGEHPSMCFICKVSDFGLCFNNKPMDPEDVICTVYYKPPSWPIHNVKDKTVPINMTTYNYASTMVDLLAHPTERWPPRQEKLGLSTFIAEDIAKLEVSTQSTMWQDFFPGVVSPAYQAQYPQWSTFAMILSLDYANLHNQDISGYMDEIIRTMSDHLDGIHQNVHQSLQASEATQEVIDLTCFEDLISPFHKRARGV